jgi:hypothetical protein
MGKVALFLVVPNRISASDVLPIRVQWTLDLKDKEEESYSGYI